MSTEKKEISEEKQKTIMVFSESAMDAGLVRQQLEEEYDYVFISTKPDMGAQDFDGILPDVLVLAFNSLEKAERCYLGIFRNSIHVKSHPHKTVVLCNKEDLARAYELCRKDYFDNYVLFWPANHDAPRLLMAMYQSFRELTKLETSSSSFFKLAHDRSDVRKDDVLANSTAAGLRTILVVDDDEFQHKLVKAMLKEENYHLVFAHGGMQAIEMMSKMKPDLVFMDMNMPDMSGIETTRRIKAMPEMTGLNVIMVTGNSERDAVRESLKAGATDFVVKPLVRDVLISKIKHMLKIE